MIMNHYTQWLNGFRLGSMVLVAGIFASSCAENQEVESQSQPEVQEVKHPFLAHEKLATTHFDLKQSDNFTQPVPKGLYNIDPKDTSKVQRVPAGPVNIITLKSTEKGFWWALATDKVTYIDGRKGGWSAVSSFTLPKVALIPVENLDAVLDNTYGSSDELAKDYYQYWAPSPMQNPTLRMMTGNSIYATVDKENSLYLTASGHIYKLNMVEGEVAMTSSIELKSQMAVPDALKDVIPLEKIPGGIQGVNIGYDGTIFVGTIFGLMAVEPDLSAVVDKFSFPIQAFFSNFPPKPGETPEFISNSFSIDTDNSVYVATGNSINKVVWKDRKFSIDPAHGAWSEAYNTGEKTPTIKYGTGTGSTPTLMDVGDDRLVVFTDGANRMHLCAFYRDAREGGQFADSIVVNCGFEKGPRFIQSEQSVATLGNGAFVVNNIAPQPEGLRDFDTTNQVADLIFNVLAVGPIVKPGRGIEKFNWDQATHKWTRGWSNSKVSSTSMVPAVSSSSNIVLINTYNQEKGWQVLGYDWESGMLVHEVNMGKTSYGNGAYALIEYFENGDLLFNGIGGPMRISLSE